MNAPVSTIRRKLRQCVHCTWKRKKHMLLFPMERRVRTFASIALCTFMGQTAILTLPIVVPLFLTFFFIHRVSMQHYFHDKGNSGNNRKFKLNLTLLNAVQHPSNKNNPQTNKLELYGAHTDFPNAAVHSLINTGVILRNRNNYGTFRQN